MSPRYAAKVDTTSQSVIAAFRQHGADWLDLSRTEGIDGVALFRGIVFLVEIKTPRSKKGRVIFTKTQRALLDRGWPIWTVTSADDVAKVLSR